MSAQHRTGLVADPAIWASLLDPRCALIGGTPPPRHTDTGQMPASSAPEGAEARTRHSRWSPTHLSGTMGTL